MAGEVILFSDGIIANILAWLPPNHAARMRLVCKQWHAVTSEHHFMHTNFSRNRAGHSISGFFLSNELHKKFSYNLLRDSATHPAAPDLSFIPDSADTVPGKIYVTSSCNGLLLCRRPIESSIAAAYKARCYVCNPATKNFVEIPAPPDGRGYYLNLAYDPPKSPVYKIVALGHTGVHVYSSQTRSWRAALLYERGSNPFSGLVHSRGVFWNGSLVWVLSRSRSLLRFAVDGEEGLSSLRCRRGRRWRSDGSAVTSGGSGTGGHLRMIGYTEEEKLAACFDVLQMAGDCREWRVLYRVDLTRVKEMYPGYTTENEEAPDLASPR
ncbi:hypothetical protein E2562_005757 [Oryza meyeriana var. granulata]|uniref:F-box domain-containing protein n=1 Tax=Oryza meyeriana var. granulata TaxID=110450 RepID=A0A6G1F4M0_9ORYZ|nr:hypothetical protein E2562_005757 [Oryza meyeriana var. granulata]